MHFQRKAPQQSNKLLIQRILPQLSPCLGGIIGCRYKRPGAARRELTDNKFLFFSVGVLVANRKGVLLYTSSPWLLLKSVCWETIFILKIKGRVWKYSVCAIRQVQLIIRVLHDGFLCAGWMPVELGVKGSRTRRNVRRLRDVKTDVDA